MKSIKITLILLFITTLVSGQIKIGGKLSYGSEIETFGVGAKAIYKFNEKFSLSGEFNYFFANNTTSTINYNGIKVGEAEVKTSLTTFNTDLHYNLSNFKELNLYAIGGLNFSFYSTKLSSENNTLGSVAQSIDLDNNKTFIGLNLGIGGSYPIASNLYVISELKYTIHDLDQIVFSAGIVYSLD